MSRRSGSCNPEGQIKPSRKIGTPGLDERLDLVWVGGHDNARHELGTRRVLTRSVWDSLLGACNEALDAVTLEDFEQDDLDIESQEMMLWLGIERRRVCREHLSIV